MTEISGIFEAAERMESPAGTIKKRLMITTRLFRRLFRKRKKYLPLIMKQAEYIQAASSILVQMMQTTDKDEWFSCENKIKTCEVQADELLTEIYEDLYDSIIVPVSRTDLQSIAMSADDLIDKINASAKSILLYFPKKIDSALEDLATYIMSSADALGDMVRCLNDFSGNFNQIISQCDRITELEHEADETYEEYVGYIFQNETDPIELMKYKNIAEVLEETSDTAKRISDNVRMILLKYMEKH